MAFGCYSKQSLQLLTGDEILDYEGRNVPRIFDETKIPPCRDESLSWRLIDSTLKSRARKYASLYNEHMVEFLYGEIPATNEENTRRSEKKRRKRAKKRKLNPSAIAPSDDNEQHEEEEEDAELESSYIGQTLWTAREKNLFFVFLGRKSRHRMDEVARCIGTKSVVECDEYLRVLELASKNSASSVDVEDFPIATETSGVMLALEEQLAEVVTYPDLLVDNSDVFYVLRHPKNNMDSSEAEISGPVDVAPSDGQGPSSSEANSISFENICMADHLSADRYYRFVREDFGVPEIHIDSKVSEMPPPFNGFIGYGLPRPEDNRKRLMYTMDGMQYMNELACNYARHCIRQILAELLTLGTDAQKITDKVARPILNNTLYRFVDDDDSELEIEDHQNTNESDNMLSSSEPESMDGEDDETDDNEDSEDTIYDTETNFLEDLDQRRSEIANMQLYYAVTAEEDSSHEDHVWHLDQPLRPDDLNNLSSIDRYEDNESEIGSDIDHS